MEVNSLGYELEISKGRGFNAAIVPDRYYYQTSYAHRETDVIYEVNLRPVKFTNERNTIRRFLCNMISGGIVSESKRYDFKFKGIPLNVTDNFRGKYTRKGESGHLHIKISNSSQIDSEQFARFLTLLTPFFGRKSQFRDTITNRAKVIFDVVTNTKNYAYCFNTGVDTFEIRINESLIYPVIVGVIIDTHIGKYKEIANANRTLIDDLRSMIMDRYRIHKLMRNLLKPVLCLLLYNALVKFEDPEYTSKFSANGRYYKTLLTIVRYNLNRYYVNAPKKFDVKCAQAFLDFMCSSSPKFRTIANNVYVRFVNDEPMNGGYRIEF